MEQLISLDTSLTTRQELLDLQASEPDELLWDQNWLPITNTGVGSNHVLHLSTGAVLYVDHWGDGDFPVVAAAGLEEAVDLWLEALIAGEYRWTGQEWTRDLTKLPAHSSRSPLIEVNYCSG